MYKQRVNENCSDVVSRAQETIDDAGTGGTGSTSDHNKGLACVRHAVECVKQETTECRSPEQRQVFMWECGCRQPNLPIHLTCMPLPVFSGKGEK